MIRPHCPRDGTPTLTEAEARWPPDPA